MGIEERRALQRFDLQAPTKVQVELKKGHKDVLSLITRDISSAGAFLMTRQPLPQGIPVELELLLPLSTLQQIMGDKKKVIVKVKGKVVRSDESGMAVAFGGKYKITAPE